MVCVENICCRLAPPNHPRRVPVSVDADWFNRCELFFMARHPHRQHHCRSWRICTDGVNRFFVRTHPTQWGAHTTANWYGGYKVDGDRRHMAGDHRTGVSTDFCMHNWGTVGHTDTPAIYSIGAVLCTGWIFIFNRNYVFDIINITQGQNTGPENETKNYFILDYGVLRDYSRGRDGDNIFKHDHTIFKIRTDSERTKLFNQPVLESGCPIQPASARARLCPGH